MDVSFKFEGWERLRRQLLLVRRGLARDDDSGPGLGSRGGRGQICNTAAEVMIRAKLLRGRRRCATYHCRVLLLLL